MPSSTATIAEAQSLVAVQAIVSFVCAQPGRQARVRDEQRGDQVS